MLEGARIGITRHALIRFRERIDPTATRDQIKEYVRLSLTAYNDGRRIIGYYNYVRFVLVKDHCRGQQYNLVTATLIKSNGVTS